MIDILYFYGFFLPRWRVDLYSGAIYVRKKFIGFGMPLNLGGKPSQWFALTAQSLMQTKSPCMGGGFDLCSAAGCILTGPMLWAAWLWLHQSTGLNERYHHCYRSKATGT